MECEYFLLVLVLFCSGNVLTVQSCSNDEDCLHRKLFLNYRNQIRPVKNSSSVVNINVTLVLNSLGVINEKDEWMTIVGFFRMKWKDEFLTWNPSLYGGRDHLIVQAQKLWLPDVVLTNSASTFYEETYKRDFKVKITSEGQVTWSFGGIFQTSCPMDLSSYPFDTQYCYIEMENWMYTLQDVNLDFTNDGAIDISQYFPNSVWNLGKPQVERNVKYGNFASLKFTFKWDRKTLYYYVNIVLPIVLMLLVALGVFWLPAECGEKISLAISVLLAFSVFQIIIMENTPVNSDVVPSITRFVILVMALASSSLLTSMFVVYISGKSCNTRAPKWLRTMCFDYIAKFLCLADGVPSCMNKKIDNESSEIYVADSRSSSISQVELISSASNGHINPALYCASSNNNNKAYMRTSSMTSTTVNSKLNSICNSVTKLQSIFEDKESSEFVSDEWKYIALIIDRMLFWTITSIMFVCVLIIWI